MLNAQPPGDAQLCPGSRIVRSCSDPVASQVLPGWDRTSFLFSNLISPSFVSSLPAPSGSPRCACSSAPQALSLWISPCPLYKH